MSEMRSGDVLELLAVVRGTINDLLAWSSATANRDLSVDDLESRITRLIENG